MPLSRAIMWIVILVTLVIGAGLYWFFTREFKGQAAETVNIAHTEALTGSNLGLVGYWTFDGNDIKWSDTTTEIKDTSGNAKHGDAQGSLTTTSATSGKTGQALSFNGTSDLVSLGNVYNGVKTVAFWAKPNSATQPFIDLNGTATINVTTGTVAANSFTSPTICVDGTATSTFPDTNWHHVVVTTGTGINASAVNLGKISSSYFGGTLDDVRFYSSALSSTQVMDLYRVSNAKETDNAAHREALTNGLVGYWTFDGRDIKWSDTGTEIKDISGNANHGDAAGSLSTTSVTPGKLGQALSFNGTSDYISFAYSGLPTGDRTIAIWAKASVLDSTYRGVFGYGNQNNGEAFLFEINDSNNWLFGTWGASNFLWSGSATLNKWTYLVGTMTNGGTANFYVDGVLVSGPVVITNGTYLTGAVIGAFPSTTNPFAGSLDDARIYNRVLSATEVASLYNAGK